MNQDIYIYPHLGMGDNILANALYREYCKQHKKVYLFVLPKYFSNIAYMLKDLKNVSFIQVPYKDEVINTEYIDSFIRFNPQNTYLKIYIPNYTFIGPSKIYKTFDEGFYKVAGIPFEDKWNKFYYERDLEKEKNVYYNILQLKDNEEFLFVHDDIPRGRIFKSHYIEKGLRVIRPVEYLQINIFDFIYTIEKSKEIHVMSSSFLDLIDTMKLKEDNLFIHDYSMPGTIYNACILNWKFLKQ